jgi:hypothetical protein
MPHPLPAYGMRIKEGIIIIYARSSYQDKWIIECLEYVRNKSEKPVNSEL